MRDRDAYVAYLQGELGELRKRLLAKEREAASLWDELGAERQLNLRLEGSVTVQLFRRLSDRLYRTIGERSIIARALRFWLRVVGRVFLDSDSSHPAPSEPRPEKRPVLVKFPRFEAPEVSIVIPIHARADLTLACLQSIRDNTVPIAYEVVMIDDDADEATRSLLARVEGAQLIRNDHSVGYLRSMNRAAAFARGRWLVLCNNNIEVRAGWLEALLRCGESAPDAGVVTPKYLYPDGRLNEAGGIIWQDGSGMNFGRGDVPDRPQYEYRRGIDYESAAALLVRADLWHERGGFDESIAPMYYEDTDLCFDARERGLRVLYTMSPRRKSSITKAERPAPTCSWASSVIRERNRPKFVAK